MSNGMARWQEIEKAAFVVRDLWNYMSCDGRNDLPRQQLRFGKEFDEAIDKLDAVLGPTLDDPTPDVIGSNTPLRW